MLVYQRVHVHLPSTQKYPIKLWFSHVYLIMLILLPFVSLAFGGLEQIWKITEKNEPLDFGVRYFRATQQQYIGSWCQLPVEIKVEKNAETSWTGFLKRNMSPPKSQVTIHSHVGNYDFNLTHKNGDFRIPSNTFPFLVFAPHRPCSGQSPALAKTSPGKKERDTSATFGVWGPGNKNWRVCHEKWWCCRENWRFCRENSSSILAWRCVVLLWQNDV